MLFKKSIGIKKTSFEKRLYSRLEIKPLYDTDLNLKLMKKHVIKYMPNENLYNYLLEHYYYINTYYTLLSIYYPLNNVAIKQKIDDVKTKCINFTYDNNPNNNINFITLFYPATLKDENMTMDNFIFFSYGLSLESADGEVKLALYNRAYFYYLFNYNNPSPNLFNFLDKIYEKFLNYDFFKINHILITENLVLVNNIFYFKFLAYMLFNTFILCMNNTLYNNTDIRLKVFLKKNSKILKKIHSEFSYAERNSIYNHYDKMLTEVKPRKKNELEIINKYNMVLYYNNLYIITKYIPKDLNQHYLSELNINYKVNLLLFNNITCFLPLTLYHYNIKNKFIYNNINIIKKFKENKKYIEIINLLNNMKQSNKFDVKNDIKTNTTDNVSYDIASIISKLNKNIITDESVAIFMEGVGRPFYDYPFYLLQLIKELYTLHKSKEIYDETYYNIKYVHLCNAQLFYSNIRYYIFNIIYTLYTLNTKFGLIHHDLHLNNITVNANHGQRQASFKTINELKDKKISNVQFLGNIFALTRNVFILKNKNIKNNAFLIPTNFYNICIIDFSRALDKKYKYQCAQELFEMVLEIYPEYSNNKEFKEKLYQVALLKTDILFDIMTGYDSFHLSFYLYCFFTDTKFLKAKFLPKIPVKEIQFLTNMHNYIKKTMLKNIKKLMASKFKGYITNTNEILMYKFYNNFLLKNYDKDDFYIPRTEKKDRPCFFQYLDDDEWIDIYNKNKINIVNIFNAENELKIKSIDEYINTYINTSDKDTNTKINRHIR
jgi:hypothetical protein